MSKKSIIQREKTRKITVKKFFKLRNQLKQNVKKVNTLEEKVLIFNKLQNLPKNSSFVRCL